MITEWGYHKRIADRQPVIPYLSCLRPRQRFHLLTFIVRGTYYIWRLCNEKWFLFGFDNLFLPVHIFPVPCVSRPRVLLMFPVVTHAHTEAPHPNTVPPSLPPFTPFTSLLCSFPHLFLQCPTRCCAEGKLPEIFQWDSVFPEF